MGMFGGPMGGMKKSSDSEGNDLKRGVKIGLKQNMEKLPEGASKEKITSTIIIKLLSFVYKENGNKSYSL